MSGPPACQERIEAFLSRQLDRWSGIPPGCREPEVAAWFELTEGSGVALRGTQQVRYAFRVLEHPSFQEGVSLFFAGGTLAFMEAEFWSFDRAECAALLEQLGNPEATGDLHWREDVIPSGLRLYPARGIALGVNPDTRLILTVTAFAPCSAEHFLACYQNLTLMVEFPR